MTTKANSRNIEDVTGNVATLVELLATDTTDFIGGEKKNVLSRSTPSDGYQGPFVLTAGDFTALLALDITNAISAPAYGKSNSEFAWLRQYGYPYLRSGPLNMSWFGLKESASYATNTLAWNSSVALAAFIEAGSVDIPSGDFEVNDQLQVYGGVVVKGQGGHIPQTKINSFLPTGHLCWIKERSSGVVGMQLSSSSTRRSSGSLLDCSLFIGGADTPESSSSTSRCIVKDISLSNGPGIGLCGIWNQEFTNYDTITVQYHKGHPFVFDDGTILGYTNRKERNFEIVYNKLRAIECGGNILIGSPGNINTNRVLTFNNLEALDCAYDTVNRISEYQIVSLGSQIHFHTPDVESQRYDEATDSQGNVKANVETSFPVKGMDIRGNGNVIHMGYFSSLSQSILVQNSAKNPEIILPSINVGDYGVAQPIGIKVNAGVTGLVIRASTQAGATKLQENQSRGADIIIDGIKYEGIDYTPSDWRADNIPVSSTISDPGQRLLVAGNITNVIGFGDVADQINNMSLSVTTSIPDGFIVTLVNPNTYNITIRHNQGGVGNILTKTLANITLAGSIAGGDRILRFMSVGGTMVQIS